MKNLSIEDKNKIYVVIGIIAVILLLIIILLVFGLKNERNDVIKNTTTTQNLQTTTGITTTTENQSNTTTSINVTTNNNNNTTTKTNINTTNTTTKKIITTTTKINENEIAKQAITKYLESFYMKNYITSYNIENIELLDENDCQELIKDQNYIYANIKITYDKIKQSVVINPDEVQIEGNEYRLNLIYIINKNTYNIEDMKNVC